MSAYYNENDRRAAAWLRELIKRGHIAPGEVDERSIEDVRPSDLNGFTQCHFFAGIGVWSYALRQAGWSDDREVWTGSCPCQPFSTAGKRAGFADERHLWPAFFHLIRECRPSTVVGEQVASKDGLAWLDIVSTDLEAEDYAFGAADLCAAGVGAPHIRQRLYWVANANNASRRTDDPRGDNSIWRNPERSQSAGDAEKCSELSRGTPTNGFWRDADWLYCCDDKWRPVEPGTFPLANGAPARMGRLRGYGNAIVAPLATTFIEAVIDVLSDQQATRARLLHT